MRGDCETGMKGSTKLKLLQRRLGYAFRNIRLLATALTHKSFINEASDKENACDNERLEFLGDAVLGLVISDFLVQGFPDYSEGQLSRIKGFIVSESFLFEIAKELELGPCLLLGRGEENSGGRLKRSILADAVEAVIAGIYLDGGFTSAHDFVIRHMGARIINLTGGEGHCIPEYKTILQEYSQGEYGCIPIYKVVSERGEDHNPEFEVNLFIDDKLCGKGKGGSKRRAEQNAALNALLKMKSNEFDH